MREAVSLQDLYRDFSTSVQFLVIYIREAHAMDGWDVGSQARVTDPVTIEERRRVAGQCEAAMAHGIVTYVDDVDDAVMTAYAAWPERLYLIDEQGRVAYRSGLGPWGFEPAELATAISSVLEGAR